MEVWFDPTSETLPKGMFGHNTTHGEILAVDEDVSLKETRPANEGRVVEPFVNFSLLRSWFTKCDKNHGRKCGTAEKEISFKGQYLIDVKRRCLVKCERSCRYLTWSYVGLQEDGALEILGHQIPIVIKDAMKVVTGLGEEYLWVDALCIVQDNEVSLEKISRMDIIYRQATLTIFAIAGNDSNSGLPGIRSNSRSLHQACQNIQGMTLTTKLADLSPVRYKSRWGSRAWTFQAEIFSRRCTRREDVLNEYYGSSASENSLEREIWATNKAYSPIFNIYESLIKIYTGKELSYQSDILNAFTGIISAMQDRFGCRFLSALPVTSFDLALLWRPMASSYPRFPSTEDSGKTSLGPFPSRCWSTTVGEIYWDPWRMAGYAGNDITLSPEIEYFIAKKRASLRIVETGRRANNSELPLAILASFNITAVELHLDLPVLCFWAKTVSLDNLVLPYEKQHPQQDNHALPPILKNWLFNKVWIYDSANHHCRTMTGLESWPLSSNFQMAKHELVIPSHCYQKVVTEEDIENNLNRLPLEQPSSQEYYDEIFDTYHYKPSVAWAANIMLIEWKGDDYAVRIAIGQIRVDALENMDLKKKLVRLA